MGKATLSRKRSSRYSMRDNGSGRPFRVGRYEPQPRAKRGLGRHVLRPSGSRRRGEGPSFGRELIRHPNDLPTGPKGPGERAPPRQLPMGRTRNLCRNSGADVHHLLPRSAGGKDEPSNLVTLCDGCHAAHHPKACWGTRSPCDGAIGQGSRYGLIDKAQYRRRAAALDPSYVLSGWNASETADCQNLIRHFRLEDDVIRTASTEVGALTPWSASRSAKPPSRRSPPPSLHEARTLSLASVG